MNYIIKIIYNTLSKLINKMKKIFVLIISLLCLFGCSSQERGSNGISVEKFTYEQHDYLMFYTITGHFTGVEHDPNCWCMNDYD